MRFAFLFGLGLFWTSCKSVHEIEDQVYCTQEVELLKGNATQDIQYSFSLPIDQQIKKLEEELRQSDSRNCLPANWSVQLGNYKLNVLLMVDWSAIDSTNQLERHETLCFRIPSISIWVNSRMSILADGEFIEFDSLANFVMKSSKSFFWDNSVYLVAYDVKWDVTLP